MSLPHRERRSSAGAGGRLDAYLIEEVLPLMLAGLLVVILLFILAGLYEVLAPILAKGASPALVARLMAFSLPESFGRGLPIAVLFAVLLGFSRLSSDAELKSMLAGGIAPTRLVWPILALTMLTAGVTFVNNELLVPRSSAQAAQTQRDIVLDNPRVLVQEKVIFTDALNRAISVDRITPGDQLEGIQIVQMGIGEPAREIITAKRGKLERGTATILLYDGERITYSSAKVVTASTFAEASLPVRDLQATLGGATSCSAVFMKVPLGELQAQIAEAQQKGWSTVCQRTALHRKFAEPLAAVAFGFFGVMLALFTLRSASGVGLVWALLLTFVYYATWSVFRVMGEQGALPPALAAWTPDLLYTAAGGALWWLSSRR